MMLLSSEDLMKEPVRQADAGPAWYALRKTLPPWRFQENLEELVELLPRYKVNELIVKVDTEEFWHGQPKLDWVRDYQPLLFKVKSELERLGIKYSLNPWTTQGHSDRGRDDRASYAGFQGLVGHDGSICKSCSCPLGAGWRSNIADVWRLYAETQPRVLWIEDDIRTFNHEPVRFSCFCPLHLERFSERVGSKVEREALVSAILQTGDPHPWRQEFLDLQGEIMVEVCSFLAGIVQNVSPKTAIGLMSSGPRLHCMEGRRWNALAGALSGGQPLYSRPTLANYYETSLRGLYYSQDSIKGTRSCLPKETIELTEVENLPFSGYSKSVVFTFLQIALSFAYGSHGVSLNLYDHCGTPMGNEPGYGDMLAKKKNFFNALAERAHADGVMRGVQLLHHERSSYLKKLGVDGAYGDLEEDGYQMMEMLESCGIPTTFDGSTVVAASGQQLRAFTDSEILTLLSQGLLLDGNAAHVLCERGFASDIGLAAIEDGVCIDELGVFAAESFHNREFGGDDNVFLTIPPFVSRPRYYRVKFSDDVNVISSLVDPDLGRTLPAFYAYENRSGGRVVVYLMDLTSIYGEGFKHPHRQWQLHAAVKWLSRNRFPLLAHSVYPLTFRKDFRDHSLLGLFNLTLDPLHRPRLECSDGRSIKRIERLSANSWVEDDSVEITTSGDAIQLRFMEDLAFDVPLLLTVYWGENLNI